MRIGYTLLNAMEILVVILGVYLAQAQGEQCQTTIDARVHPMGTIATPHYPALSRVECQWIVKALDSRIVELKRVDVPVFDRGRHWLYVKDGTEGQWAVPSFIGGHTYRSKKNYLELLITGEVSARLDYRVLDSITNSSGGCSDPGYPPRCTRRSVTLDGSLLRYECQPGYRRVGEDLIHCDRSRNSKAAWDFVPPTCLPSGCGGVIRDLQGVLSSPNYPKVLKDYTECRWNLKISEGEEVLFTFSKNFDIGVMDTLHSSSLSIIDISTKGKQNIMKSFSMKSDLPLRYTSKARNIMLEFVGTGRFRAAYQGPNPSQKYLLYMYQHIPSTGGEGIQVNNFPWLNEPRVAHVIKSSPITERKARKGYTVIHENKDRLSDTGEINFSLGGSCDPIAALAVTVVVLATCLLIVIVMLVGAFYWFKKMRANPPTMTDDQGVVIANLAAEPRRPGGGVTNSTRANRY